MSSLELQEHIPLAPFTTLGIGGPARFFARITSEAQLGEAVTFAKRNHLPIFPLGGGSNLLVHDEGFPGLVVQLDLQGRTITGSASGTIFYDVAAGTPWDAFVLDTCQNGLTGAECLAGIPGLTGGTPVQNVGAYGQEVAQIIHHVRVFDLRTCTFQTLSQQECGFTYRSSIFNTHARGRYLVTAVRFAFDRNRQPVITYSDLKAKFPDGSALSPMEIYHAVLAIRKAKGMLLTEGDPNSLTAGSFFKNPVIPEADLTFLSTASGVPAAAVPHWKVQTSESHGGAIVKLAAAWLVERAGFSKGFREGSVGISSRHSLALINYGGATSAALVTLRDRIRDAVFRRFRVVLEQEPVELGPGWPATR